MKYRQETLINREDLPEAYQFQASITSHPVIRDEQGVIRYQVNPLVEYLHEHVSMNDMVLLYQRGAWSQEQFMQFYRDIGYSLSGFNEVWGEELDEMESEMAQS